MFPPWLSHAVASTSCAAEVYASSSNLPSHPSVLLVLQTADACLLLARSACSLCLLALPARSACSLCLLALRLASVIMSLALSTSSLPTCLLLYVGDLLTTLLCALRQEGPRISISFNLVDDELEGGRYGWGEATAVLEVVTLEEELGLEPRRGEEEDDEEEGDEKEGDGVTGEAMAAAEAEEAAAAALLRLDGIRSELALCAEEAAVVVSRAAAAHGRAGSGSIIQTHELHSVLGLLIDESQALMAELTPAIPGIDHIDDEAEQ